MIKKQKKFVEEYLKCLNGSEAARRAGYSVRCAHQQAYENLRKPYIRAAIDQGLAERSRAIERELEARSRYRLPKILRT